jgi:hypothetical protein
VIRKRNTGILDTELYQVKEKREVKDRSIVHKMKGVTVT